MADCKKAHKTANAARIDANKTRNIERAKIKRMQDAARVSCMKVPRGTARKIRRDAGDYQPVEV